MQNKGGAMDTDQVIDVPDTPDRLAALNINHQTSVAKVSATSVPREYGNSNFLLRGRSRVLPDQQHSKGQPPRAYRSLKNPEVIHPQCYPVLHLSDSPPVFENNNKRTAAHNSNHNTVNYFGGTHLDKGKAVGPKPLVKKSTFREDTVDLDSTEQTGCSRTLKAARNVSSNCMPNSSGNSHKGKGMACDSTGRALGINTWKGIDLTGGSPLEVEKFASAPAHSFTPTPPRITGQKRLVRNGCISPLNIAKLKQSTGPKENGSAFKAANNIMVPRGPSCVIDIGDSSAECSKHDTRKGKAVIGHSRTQTELDEISIHIPVSSMKPNAGVIGDINVNASVSLSSEELNGWRNTRNRAKKNDPNVLNPAKVATKTKRQKKHEGTSCSHGESATGADDSEITFPGSLGESSNLSSKRNLRSRRRSSLDPLVEVDELSPELALFSSHHGARTNHADSEARARQLEADETLALELQQQLYQESPLIVGGGEADAHIAWALQQEDATQYASSSGARGIMNSRRSSISAMHRQQRPRSLQNPSFRSRLLRARDPTGGGMAQLRGRGRRQAPSILPSGRNLFPFRADMDLDARLDILAALEAAAVGDFGDMGMGGNHHQGLHTQRDFNENDYEMLLALDENNHEHGGARVDQINRLPQSVVESDNNNLEEEEACAICLETPSRGETIRHLPCFHKFHKECIDPWLNRKTSCPVCKSSITT